MKRLAAVAALALLLLSGLARPAPAVADDERSPEVLAELGRDAYKNGQYEDARDAFEEMVRRGFTSGALFHDLGNTYYRLGDMGRSLLAYRRAELFLPRDGDVEANLAHVRQGAVDKLEAPDGGLDFRDLIFWYDALTLQEQTVMAILLGAFAWAGLFLWRLRGKSRLPLSVPVLFVATAIVAATAGARYVELTRTPGAVVIHPEITARSGTDAKSVALFYLHEGAEVKARGDLDGEWVQIELPDGRRGWVERRFVGLVLPNEP